MGHSTGKVEEEADSTERCVRREEKLINNLGSNFNRNQQNQLHVSQRKEVIKTTGEISETENKSNVEKQ